MAQEGLEPSTKLVAFNIQDSGGTARTEPYGSYLKGGKSQVGMATLDAPYFYVRPDR